MAKDKSKKLEMVPKSKFAEESAALVSQDSLLGSLAVSEQLPDEKDLERLNLPPMLDVKLIPVGVTVSGVLVKLVENFTGRDDMRKARLLHLKKTTPAGDVEFLMPLTGVIRNAFKPLLDCDPNNKDDYTLKPEAIGKTYFFKRLPDGIAKKFGGKTMFQFDVLFTK